MLPFAIGRSWPTAGACGRQVRSKSIHPGTGPRLDVGCSVGRHLERDGAARKLTPVGTGSRPKAVGREGQLPSRPLVTIELGQHRPMRRGRMQLAASSLGH